MIDYWRFFRKETHLLAFGLSFTFLSSLGQTFLVSLFVPHFLTAFELSGARFGSLYSGATLLSALLLPWAGGRMDRIPLSRFTIGVVGLLAVSSLLVAGAWNLAVLGLALLGIRLSGQGLSTHVALTAMARYYERGRGRALSIASLGYPLGEGVLPLAVTASIALLGWRSTWVALAILAAALMGPVLLWLLRRADVDTDPQRMGPDREARGGSGGDPTRDPESRTDPSGAPTPSTDWSRREVLRDVRFWSVLPAALLPPFWGTGLFLYQTTIAEIKGWSVTLMASAFVAYAVSRVVFGLAVGGGIDRASARRIFPTAVLPLGVGMAVLLWADAPWVAYVFMALVGVTMGMSANLKAALWAELYGTRHLGAIKSMMASIVVVSTAVAPVLVGYVLEDGGRLDALLLGGVASVGVSTVLALKVFSPGRRRPCTDSGA